MLPLYILYMFLFTSYFSHSFKANEFNLFTLPEIATYTLAIVLGFQVFPSCKKPFDECMVVHSCTHSVMGSNINR